MGHTFLITAWLMWLLTHSSRMITSSVLPLIEDDFGITHATAGRFLLFMMCGYCLMFLSAAFWSRRFGYIRTVRTALMSAILILVAMRWASNTWSLSALMFLMGMATGTILPSVLPLVTQTYGKDRWGRSIAFFDTAAPAGQFIAPLIAVAVLTALPWSHVFFAMAILACIAWMMFLKTAPRAEPEVEGAIGSIVAVFRNQSLVTLAGLWILASACANGVGFLIPTYLVKERGMDLTAANQVVAAGRGAGILAVLSAGFLADRFPCRNLLAWVLTFVAVSLFGIALWPENVGISIFVIIEAVVQMMFFPVGLILISRLTSAGVRGAATGLVIGVGVGIGIGVTPWVLGAIADAWSFQAGISMLGAITLLAGSAVTKIEKV